MLDHIETVPLAPSRVVVLGAGGFVGRAVTARLADDGVDHLALTRAEVDLLADGAAVTLAGLLRPRDALVVVSAKAPCKDNDSLLDNIAMMRAVCAAVGEVALTQVVYVSSDAVYGAAEGPLTETSCAQPADLHGAMHLVRETMLRATLGETPLCILRPSLLYGASDPHNGYGPNRFRRQAAEGRITLFGEGEEERDHVYVGDLAEIARLCLVHRSRGVLNVATGAAHSFHHVARRVADHVDNPVAIEGTPRANPIVHRHFDATACAAAFPGFRFTPLEEGIELAQKGLG